MLYKGLAGVVVLLGCIGLTGPASAYVPFELGTASVKDVGLRPSYGTDRAWLNAPASGGADIVVANYSPAPSIPPRAGDDYGIFGSVAVPMSTLPAAKKWQRVSAALDCPKRKCGNSTADALRKTLELASGKSPFEALSLVNNSVNNLIRYRADRADIWATPSETVAAGAGDCEDFAIAKMWMLRAMGYTPEQLQLVVLRNKKSGAFHAVLVVHTGDANYVLDNLSNHVKPDAMIKNYLPIQSFAGNRVFIHGFENKTVESASLAP
jgi:predicted transglutaminase-like cysteine proteinase